MGGPCLAAPGSPLSPGLLSPYLPVLSPRSPVPSQSPELSPPEACPSPTGAIATTPRASLGAHEGCPRPGSATLRRAGRASSPRW